ncbi:MULTISPECIES: hypothetical protein [Commensalibacter]|uniref:DUF883 domain-containing protein n=2 Tax=Commensalibacter TaxID=1079922 RepID=W7DSA9_9PROT|nr:MULTISPECIES: hypothetical protein [Commensalibacter]EUK17790.1 hypothetical protein COMX_07345 [Commensalibacter papalotli (ex Servin-Garciduenas et al. 2014)]CAI3944026.1 unnamed protein product [Commensalibacter papalotli (ex Botero et al. 2024)]CAI3946857.1 unnamed protein product [Commensalibacter papalotli (ex Botero et al. 2024)]
MFFSKKDKKKVAALQKNAQEEIKSLKNQVEELLNDRVTPAIVQAADKADQVVHNTKEMTDHQIKHVSDKVQSKPLIAIVLSIVIGYLLGRVIR